MNSLIDGGLQVLFFPDAAPWERSALQPILDRLAAWEQVETVDVATGRRQGLRLDDPDKIYWLVAHDWRAAIKSVSLGARARVFVSVLKAAADSLPSLAGLFVRRLAGQLPPSVKLLAMSPLSRRFLCEMEGFFPEQVIELPLPFTGGDGAPEQLRLENPPADIRVGTFAPFVAQSNLHYLMNVAHYVCGRDRRARFTIFGSGKLEGHLKEIGRCLGLTRVEIVVAESAACLKELDVFVYTPLRNDHFAPLLMATAEGLPVLSNEVPGIEALVADGVDGFVLPVNETKPMAELILRLVDSPELRASLGGKLRRTTSARYSAEQLAVAYREAFFGNTSADEVTDGAVAAG